MISIFRKNGGPDYLDYDTYKQRIDFLDSFYFQQATRKESMRNTHFF